MREDGRMATTEAHDTSPGGGTAVVHLDPSERARMGRAARAAVSRCLARRVVARTRSCRSDVAPDRPGDDARPGARSAPPRADARVAVHLLPRCGRDHGRRPRVRPTAGCGCRPCGDAHLSNFGGFSAPGPHAALRHQRFRRDQSRTVRVGRQASRRELRDRGARPCLFGEGDARTSSLGSRSRTGRRWPSSPR